MFEAAVHGPVRAFLADVPFAGHKRMVATLPDGFGDGDAAVVQAALVGGCATVFHHVAYAVVSTDARVGQQRAVL